MLLKKKPVSELNFMLTLLVFYLKKERLNKDFSATRCTFSKRDNKASVEATKACFTCNKTNAQNCLS